MSEDANTEINDLDNSDDLSTSDDTKELVLKELDKAGEVIPSETKRELVDFMDRISSEARREFLDVIGSIPSGKRGNLAKVVVEATHKSYSGPIPPPEFMGEYENVLAGSADRILSMSEEEQKHRHYMQSTGINAAISHEKLGTILGFILALILLVGGVLLIVDGKSAEGLVLIGAEALALAGAFIVARNPELLPKKSRDEDD